MQSTSAFLTRYPPRYSYTRTPLNNPPPRFSLGCRLSSTLPTLHSSILPDLSKLISINFYFIFLLRSKKVYISLASPFCFDPKKYIYLALFRERQIKILKQSESFKFRNHKKDWLNYIRCVQLNFQFNILLLHSQRYKFIRLINPQLISSFLIFRRRRSGS